MKHISKVVIIVLVVFSTSQLRASIIYPDVMGATVNFTNIEEDSPSGDPLPLYGLPAANGDQLIFPTTGNFSASSLAGSGPDETDGKLGLMVKAKPGNFINNIGISENGLVALNAPFGGDALAQVITFAVIKIAEINNAPVNIPAMNVFLNVAPLNGSYQLSLIGGSAYSNGWTGNVGVPVPPGTTKVNLVLNNNLFAATTGAGTRAFIDKKAFEIDIHTRVPEPATIVMAAIAGVLVSLYSGRRRLFDS